MCWPTGCFRAGPQLAHLGPPLQQLAHLGPPLQRRPRPPQAPHRRALAWGRILGDPTRGMLIGAAVVPGGGNRRLVAASDHLDLRGAGACALFNDARAADP